MDRRDTDGTILYASVDKANKLLGWQTIRDLKEMCLSAGKCMSSNKYFLMYVLGEYKLSVNLKKEKLESHVHGEE